MAAMTITKREREAALDRIRAKILRIFADHSQHYRARHEIVLGTKRREKDEICVFVDFELGSRPDLKKIRTQLKKLNVVLSEKRKTPLSLVALTKL